MAGLGYQKQSSHLILVLLLLGAITWLVIQNYQKDEALLKVKKELARQNAAAFGKDQKLQKFTLAGYDKQGKKFWNLEGQTANIDVSQTIKLEQDVNLTFEQNTLINTDRVEWSQAKGLLTTDAPVFVDHANAKIKGLGAIGRPSDNYVQLNRHIDMLLNNQTRVSCKGPMKIFYNENRMELYRTVRIRDQKGTLTSRRMDIDFDPQTKKITKIIASGDVVINRGADTSRSDRAIYSVETGSIKLEGDPKISVHAKSSGSGGLLNGAFGN